MQLKKIQDTYKRFIERSKVDPDIYAAQKNWEDDDGETLDGVLEGLKENAGLHPFLLIAEELNMNELETVNDILSTFSEIREDYLFVKERIDAYFMQVFKAIEWYKVEALNKIDLPEDVVKIIDEIKDAERRQHDPKD